MIKELWVEKYRPKHIHDYVFRDNKQKNQINEWISNKVIPHLLFSGIQGIGKTTLALILFNELGADKADILELNASNDNSVEVVRSKVSKFVNTMSFGSEFRYVLLDEADYLTPNAQAVLRGLMEKYSATSRFVLTCNYPEKIMPAIHSRCQGFHLEKLDKGDFDIRVATILANEEIEFDLDLLDSYVRATYPDLRKCINSLQQNCINGVLISPNETDVSRELDYKIEMVELFKSGKINQARKLVCSKARPEEIGGIYKFLYQNLEFWGDETNQEKAILIIRDGLYKHAFCADSEINLAATLVQLSEIGN